MCALDVSDAPTCLQYSLIKGPVPRGASGGSRLVTPRVLHPLCVRVRCAPDPSGVHLTTSSSLKVTVRDRRARFKKLACAVIWSTGRWVRASGGSPVARPVAPCFV